MRRAGVNLVTLGVFGWAQVEPDPGSFDFTLFDRVIDGLYEAGIRVCLATMTASPPAWLATAHPEMLPVRADGTRLWPGARQGYCPSSPIYREHAVRLVEQVASRYADAPRPGGLARRERVRRPRGGVLLRRERDRLPRLAARAARICRRAERGLVHGVLVAGVSLVRRGAPAAVGADVLQPGAAARLRAVQLRRHARVLPRGARGAPPAHPRGAGDDELLRDLEARRLLVMGAAPGHREPGLLPGSRPTPRPTSRPRFNYDLVRSLKGGRPWLLMEQAPAAVNWRLPQRHQARQGRCAAAAGRRWPGVRTRSCSSSGASRAAARRSGTRAWSRMRGPDSRTFREVTELGGELVDHARIAGTRVEAEVAVVMDWPNWWALELDSHPSNERDPSRAAAGPLRPAVRGRGHV